MHLEFAAACALDARQHVGKSVGRNADRTENRPVMSDRVLRIQVRNDFSANEAFSRFAERLYYSSRRRGAHDIYPFENVVHDSLKTLVESQVKRLVEDNF